MNNEQVLLAKYPKGMPQDDTSKYENIDIVDPKENEIQIESLHIFVDPYMRGRVTQVDSYVGPFKIGEPIQSHVVGKIIKSNSEKFNEDDIIVGMLPWRRINTVNEEKIGEISNTDIPLYLYLSTLGVAGQTAYHGLLETGQPKEDDTIVVSTASGAVGAVVGRIVRIKGARVVGIAGGGRKVNYLTEGLDFDAGIDYKKDDFVEALAKAIPNGVDVYFENVGGTIADEVMKHLNRHARIPAYGTISNYNNTERKRGPRVQSTLIKHQALMCGFLVAEFADDFERASKGLAARIQERKIKTKVFIEEGFEYLPKAFRNLLTGGNFGEQIVKVSGNVQFKIQ